MKSRFARIALGLANVAAFGGSLFLSCLGIHRSLPIPEIPEVQAKLTYLRDHIDDFDTLFLGTSRIYRHVIPKLFDGLTTERDVPTKSFNAAADGMRPPEDSYVFDQILKYHPKHLRWVFLELWWLRLSIDDQKRQTNRLVYWHDTERLGLLFQEALNIKKARHWRGTLMALAEPMGIFLDHVSLFFENMTNMGRGASWMDWVAYPPWPEVDLSPLGPNLDGFHEIKRPTPSESELAVYRKALAIRTDHPATAEAGSPASQEALRRLVRKIEALGATPILIIPPTTAGRNFHPPPEDGQSPIIFDFSDVHRFPALYDERNRLDTDHLNTAGAEIFTRLLAERFAEVAHGRK